MGFAAPRQASGRNHHSKWATHSRVWLSPVNGVACMETEAGMMAHIIIAIKAIETIPIFAVIISNEQGAPSIYFSILGAMRLLPGHSLLCYFHGIAHLSDAGPDAR